MRRFVYAIVGVGVAFVVAAGLVLVHALDRSALGYAALMAAAAGLLCMLGYSVGRREDALVETSMTDPLTQLGNRRMFDLCLARELGRAVESHMPLAVLALDLDDLKVRNDRSGHDAGDRALVAVADVLRVTCRSRDLAARTGGDEFAVMMPRSTANEAAVLGERVRAALRARAPDVTVSIGAADLEQVGGRDPAALLAAADEALYAAKQAGRNRLVVLAVDATRAPAAAPARCADGDAGVCAHAAPQTTSARCAHDVTLSLGAPPEEVLRASRERERLERAMLPVTRRPGPPPRVTRSAQR